MLRIARTLSGYPGRFPRCSIQPAISRQRRDVTRSNPDLDVSRCGEGFPSAMQMDPPTFDSIRLESMIERCSACAHAFRFKKDDYFFAVED